MKLNQLIIGITILAATLSACEEEETVFEESKTAVVAGYLFAEKPVDSIVISQSFSYNQSDSTILLLDNLEVRLSDFEDTYFLESIGNGVYRNPDIIVEADKSYRLEFVWEDEVIGAETYIPLKKEGQLSIESISLEKIEAGSIGGPPTGSVTDPIEISWDNSEGDYYYILIENMEDNPEYVNDNIAQFEDENGGRQRFTFISEPTITDIYQINARRELTQFGTHRIIIFRVNPEYAALYESSSNSTQSLEQPPTNVENGLGIFTGVNSDTLYLEVEEI